MRHARLSEVDGLPLKGSGDRLPHPVELSRWEAAGWIKYDYDHYAIHLTEAGREQAEVRGREKAQAQSEKEEIGQ